MYASLLLMLSCGTVYHCLPLGRGKERVEAMKIEDAIRIKDREFARDVV